jgi:hypothetical protein
MADWEFKHSIFTVTNRKKAWDFWADMSNHAKMEPGIKRIELDGPFASGTKGRTIIGEFTQEWKLTEVSEGKRFVITGITPDGEGRLSFAWDFEDDGSGTRITQQISAYGPQVEEYLDVLREMGDNTPKVMSRLVAKLNRLA